MNYRRFYAVAAIAVLLSMLLPACSTRHVGEGHYLLRRNNVKVKTDALMINKGEIKDNLAHLIAQHPNTYTGLKRIPLKLWWYNIRYKKLSLLPDTSLPKSAELPVIYDSSLIARSIFNMRSYLFNQGYFYPRITDTVIYHKKKASVSYVVYPGLNYLINKVTYDVDDSSLAQIIRNNMDGSGLIKNKVFTFSMLDEERSRLGAVIRRNGYYQFTQEYIRFVIDTMDKTFLRDVENPLENALNFIAQTRINRKPTLDINAIIRTKEDTVNVPYRIKKVTIYPDYSGIADRTDTTMLQVESGGMLFKFHDVYVHAKVVADRIFLRPGNLYSQEDHDKSIAKLNELGIFQYIRIQISEHRSDSSLSVNIYLNKTRKFDVNANFEVSNGSTYILGNSLSLSFRDKNFAHGANLFMVSLNGGLELSYYDTLGKSFIDHFRLLTQYYGVNTSIDFPKFLAPVAARRFSKSNLPHTLIMGGSNVINRVDYFTLVNTSAYFKYSWRETNTKYWELSPAFVNIIRLPRKTAAFQDKLDHNQFLKDSYKQVFIEGENLTYTYNNIEQRRSRNYSRLKLGLEEAGGLLGGINSFGYALNDLYKIQYAQYAKFDFDFQHFFTLPHSVFAVRFYGGIGVPYGQSTVLPYVKQYYVGGPYSLRGWRIRSLGPGSYIDTSAASLINTLDRTGDIKLEMNGEYRFPITPLFAGMVKMNGAVFADAGNIWLAKSDSTTRGGEFALSKLGQDVAVDIGAGSRFEIASFLTLRLDVAMPVKKPYIFTNGGWVFKDIDFSKSGWRAQNLIVNISIGYPF